MRFPLHQPLAQIQPAGAAQPHVAQHHVGVERGHDPLRGLRVRGVTDHADAPQEPGQHGLQPLEDHLVIVDEHDA